MNLRGAACFDWDLYYQKNGETLQLMETREQAWTHFVNNGQFSGEAFRWVKLALMPCLLGFCELLHCYRPACTPMLQCNCPQC